MNGRTAIAFVIAAGLASFGTVVACSSSSGGAPPSNDEDAGLPPPAPTVASVEDLGVVADPDGGSFGRDGTSSCEIGGQILYTFGDTFLFTPAADGASLRTNTAAYAELATPTVLHEPLDEAGLPSQMIPFTDDELAYNADAGNQGGHRIALWPGKCVTTPDGNALVFFDALEVKDGLLNFLSMGMATVTPGSTTATRLPGALFTAPEPDYFHAAMIDQGFLYLYSCTNATACRVARAPIASATMRASYTYWNGTDWVAGQANAVVTVPGSPAGFSVAFNAYLGTYVSFTTFGARPDLVMRQAPTPVGPWSDPTTVMTFPSNVYAGGQHAELDEEGGRVVYVTAFRDLGSFRGEIRMLKVTLAK